MTRHRLETGEVAFDIREIYYDAADNPVSWCADPASPSGETKDELIADISKMSTCIGTKVLDLDELEESLKQEKESA